MAVRSTINQYRGINAHLHSFWQAQRSWGEFHNPHITYLLNSLRAQLLPIGYSARVERSLQIRRIEDFPRSPESDLTIYDLNTDRYLQARSPAAQSMTGVVLPLPNVLEDQPISEKPYQAISIYLRSEIPNPVAWIEVLSPTNKRPGEDALAYTRKRTDLLAGGIVFVELDYLHETPPTLALLPDYSDLLRETKHPYRIVVLDPRPDMLDGWASINEFDVDDPIPEVVIPLSDDDLLHFDFGAPYQKQIIESLYSPEFVDYSRFPVNFDRYSPADQTRIARRMLSVLDAHHAGTDLETGPFPVKDIPLDAALEQIVALTKG